MSEASCTIPVPKTSQELEQAVLRYRSIEPNDPALLAMWEAIRDASLNQAVAEVENDKVPGEESY